MTKKSNALAAATVCAMLAVPLLVGGAQSPAIPPSLVTPDKVPSRIGTLEFKDGAPTVETAEKVRDALDFTSEVELVR